MKIEERILKLALGGKNNSFRDLDNADDIYNKALSDLNENQELDDLTKQDRKDQASAYLTYYANQTSGDVKTNKNSRHGAAEAKRIAASILDGTFNAANTASGLTETSGRRLEYADAGRHAVGFMNLNANRSKSSSTTTVGNTGTRGRFTFDWSKGLTSEIEGIDDSLKDRVLSYASTLKSNIAEARSERDANKLITGSWKDEHEIELQAIIDGLNNGSLSEKDAYKKLGNVAKYYDTTGTHWLSYFSNFIPKVSPADKEHARLLNEENYQDIDESTLSPWVRNQAKSKNLKFLKDLNGNIKAFNNDWTSYAGSNFFDVNDEEGTEGYGHVMLQDENGNWYLGEAPTDVNNPFNNLYQSRLGKLRADRSGLYTHWNFADTDYALTPEMLQIADLISKEYNIGQRDINGTDVSKLFAGDEKIFAFNPNGSSYDVDSTYGRINFGDGTKFYVRDGEGNISVKTFDQLRDKFNRNGWSEGNDKSLGLFLDIDYYLNDEAKYNTINPEMDMYGRTYWDSLLNSFGITADVSSAVAGALGGYGKYRNMSHMMEELSKQMLASDKAYQKALKKVEKGTASTADKLLIKKAERLASEKVLKETLFKRGSKLAIERAFKQIGKKVPTKLGLRLAGLSSGAVSFGIGTAITAALTGLETGIQYGLWDNVNEHPDEFVLNVLNAVSKGGLGDLKIYNDGWLRDSGISTNSAFLDKIKFNEKESEYTKFIFELMKNNPSIYSKLSPEEKAAWRQLKIRYNANRGTASAKNGGILKAAKGVALTPDGDSITSTPYENPELKQARQNYNSLREKIKEAENKGYDGNLYRLEASEESFFGGDGKMKSADAMRLATLALDTASIVASFMPGAGTGVAAGLGVTSMLTDLAADMIDPAVTKGEVLTNLGMNAGFAAMGLIPGAKVGKVTKSLIKWAPKIVTAAAGLGIAMDESTQNTFKKLGDGTLKLNREDWRNISHVLSLVAAGTRGIKGDIARHSIKKNSIIASDNVTIKGLDSVEGKPLEFLKETIKNVNKALGEIKTSEEGAEAKALQILKSELNLNDDQAAAILQSPTFKKVKGGIGKYKIEEVGVIDANKNYDNLRAIWNEEAKTLENSPTFLKRFANKFGGGSYTDKQRAILETLRDAQNPLSSRIMEYDTHYNPMIDYQGLRQKAGEYRIGRRSNNLNGQLHDIAPKGMFKSGKLNSDFELKDRKHISKYLDAVEKDVITPAKNLDVTKAKDTELGESTQSLLKVQGEINKALQLEGLSAELKKALQDKNETINKLLTDKFKLPEGTSKPVENASQLQGSPAEGTPQLGATTTPLTDVSITNDRQNIFNEIIKDASGSGKIEASEFRKAIHKGNKFRVSAGDTTYTYEIIEEKGSGATHVVVVKDVETGKILEKPIPVSQGPRSLKKLAEDGALLPFKRLGGRIRLIQMGQDSGEKSNTEILVDALNESFAKHKQGGQINYKKLRK